jgi:hypothetical protein
MITGQMSFTSGRKASSLPASPGDAVAIKLNNFVRRCGEGEVR